jgi:hypothetical protein
MRPAAVLLSVVLLSACDADSTVTSPTTTVSTETVSTTTTSVLEASALDELPEGARTSTGGGQPRSPGYWIAWSTCGENSQAEAAASNGGREAGWYLIDDFLESPGVAVGDHLLGSCEAAVDLLSTRDVAGPDRSDDPTYQLASQVLTAELNLNAGAESCPVIDQTLVVAHALLAAADFDGAGADPGVWTGPQSEAAARLIPLIRDYNAAELCR